MSKVFETGTVSISRTYIRIPISQPSSYSYECTAAKQERPYVSRPSRTQQLLNPKLAPKIVEATPKSRQPQANREAAQGSDGHDGKDVASRPRSRSRSASSESVSTISTRSSRSRSPPVRRSQRDKDRSRSPVARRTGLKSEGDRSRDPPREVRNLNRSSSRASRPRTTSRDRHRSRSPFRTASAEAPGLPAIEPARNAPAANKRDRSLSPYSKRVAMMNGR